MPYRYNWWGHVINILKSYPQLKADFNELKRQSITPSYTGMTVNHSGISRPIEQLAIKELPTYDMRCYEAVRRSLENVSDDTLEIINLVYWKRSHTLHGAALKCDLSYSSARRRQRVVIVGIAKRMGWVD